MPSASPVRPLPSATVLVLRDGDDGLEVLLVRRRQGRGFAAGAWVFPGGVVADADRSLPPACRSHHRSEARSACLRLASSEVTGRLVAGIRETFEEAGLLLARHADGRRPDARAPAVAAVRRRLAKGQLDAAGFARWLAEDGLVCDLDAIVPLRRMVTPRQSDRRFDTLFLLARAPEGQDATIDDHEVTDLWWARPALALEAGATGRLAVMHPTVRALEAISDLPGVAEAEARARAEHAIPPVLPHLEDPGGSEPPRLLEPGDADYPLGPYAEEFPAWGDLAAWGEVPPWSR